MFCHNFKRIRQQCKFTQQEVADRLHITVQAISKWENGAAFPSTPLLPELSKLFKCSIDDFFVEEQNSNINIELIKKYFLATITWASGDFNDDQMETVTEICFEQTLCFLSWLEGKQTTTLKELLDYFKCSQAALLETIETLDRCNIISWLDKEDLLLIKEGAHQELLTLTTHWLVKNQKDLNLSDVELQSIILQLE